MKPFFFFLLLEVALLLIFEYHLIYNYRNGFSGDVI